MIDFMVLANALYMLLTTASFCAITSRPINLVSSLPLSVVVASTKSSKFLDVANATISKSFSVPIVSLINWVVATACSPSNSFSSPSGSI